MSGPTCGTPAASKPAVATPAAGYLPSGPLSAAYPGFRDCSYLWMAPSVTSRLSLRARSQQP